MIPPVAAPRFERYLAQLRWLVEHPTPFTEPAAVSAMMSQVRDRMVRWLPGHACRIDSAGNLIAVPEALDGALPLLYLSAHLDTVPSQPELWAPPFAPHPPHESANELVAQGVNDCKAGVAAQLWLAELAGSGALKLRNGVFMVTFKEEGAGEKSGVALGEAFGHALPRPTPGSTLLVLENTVGSSSPHLPQIYASEASSFTIRLTGTLPELQRAQEELRDWRPVSVLPIEDAPETYAWTRYTPQGHVCSAPPEANPLAAALRQAGERALLRAGDERSHGTVPAEIGRAQAPRLGVRHRLTLTKRGIYDVESVTAELNGRDYVAVKALALSGGFDASPRLPGYPVGRACTELVAEGEAELARNIGSSDATIITSSLGAADRQALLPLVCGPGTRSQRSAVPPRLTHGPNETFVKSAGARSLALILELLRRSGHVT